VSGLLTGPLCPSFTIWHYLADLHFISFLTFRSAIFETTWLLIADYLSSMQQTTTALTTEAGKVGLCNNPEKCKILITIVWNDRTDIQVTVSDIEKVDDFCYLGSYISHNGSCEKDVRVRIGKATAVFGKMRKIWKNKCISLKVKMSLYEAIVLSTLLYSAKVWPLTVTITKRLNAAQPITDGKGASWVSPGRTE